MFDIVLPRLRPIRLSSIGTASSLGLLMAALWMAGWYAAWLWLRDIHGQHEIAALKPVVIGFAPLLLWALFDYRVGLLLAVIASPLLAAPIIPHGFTQGFGDLFAACAIIGFVLRHPHPSYWLHLWRREYVWLVLILIAAFVSLATSPVWGQEVRYGVKYGLAEIAGYCLAFSYLAVMTHELRDKRDIRVALYAVAAAMLIVAIFSIVALDISMQCSGGYGARTLLTANQAIMSTFENPNYHAGFLLAVLPLALLSYLRGGRGTLGRRILAVIVISLIFMVQAAMSRSGLLGLVIVWLGWLAISRWQPGTRSITVILGLMLPMTVVLWWYPGCSCSDIPSGFCRPLQALGFKELAQSMVNPPKGWNGDVRLALLHNAWNAWREYPITGVGVSLLANYSSVDGHDNRAHNMVLTILAEQGVIGMLAWVGWLGSLTAVFWRARRLVAASGHAMAFLALAFVVVAVEALFMDYYRAIWLWQLSALILAAPGVIHRDKNESRPAASRWR